MTVKELKALLDKYFHEDAPIVIQRSTPDGETFFDHPATVFELKLGENKKGKLIELAFRGCGGLTTMEAEPVTDEKWYAVLN